MNTRVLIKSLPLFILIYLCLTSLPLNSKSEHTNTENIKSAVNSIMMYAWVEGLSIRKKPGLSGKKLGSLKEGETVIFTGKKSSFKTKVSLRGKKYRSPWFKIKNHKGLRGWVFGGGVHRAIVAASDGSGHFKKIQDAIDFSKKGDHILVKDGEYSEDLKILNKNKLVIRGQKKAWIKTPGSDATIITIRDSKQITISHIKAVHVTEYNCIAPVVRLRNAHSVTINNCILNGSGFRGIDAMNSTHLTVIGNTITQCSYGGIYFNNIKKTLVRKNIITNNGSGSFNDAAIHIRKSSGIKFEYNTVAKNSNRSLLIEDCGSISFNYNIFAFNRREPFIKNSPSLTGKYNLFHKKYNLQYFTRSIIDDPQFADLSGNDFRLRKESPAVKRGEKKSAIGALGIARKVKGPYYPRNSIVLKIKHHGKKKPIYMGAISPMGWNKNGVFAYLYSTPYVYACESNEYFEIIDLKNNKVLWSSHACDTDWHNDKPASIKEFKKQLVKYKIAPIAKPQLKQFPAVIKRKKYDIKINPDQKKGDESGELSTIGHSILLVPKKGSKRLLHQKKYKYNLPFSIGAPVKTGYFKSPKGRYLAVLIPDYSQEDYSMKVIGIDTRAIHKYKKWPPPKNLQ
ncbi:MAG: SH3 domain-containing protein [bacterium]|nr:SH3 domain-containing protein [bacterium]